MSDETGNGTNEEPPLSSAATILATSRNPFALLGLERVLAHTRFTLVTVYLDWPAVIQKAQSASPHVCILDLPCVTSTEVESIRSIIASTKAATVVMLWPQDSHFVPNLLDAGVRNILLKAESCPKYLIEAIEAARSGSSFLDRSSSRALEQAIARKFRNPDTPGIQRLTMEEVKILALIAEGLANKEIATKLGLETRSVEHRRKIIENKLQLKGTARLTRFAIQYCQTRLE